MALAAVTSADFAPDRPRESISVQRVAKILGCHDSEVRKLVADGDLQGWTLGKRSIRIFLDSVTSYQQRQLRPATAKTQAAPAAKRRTVTNAAHENAMRRLRVAGYRV